jgi:ankyrin repeat protein
MDNIIAMKDVGKVKKVKGEYVLILAVDNNAEAIIELGLSPGFTSIYVDHLTMRLDEIFSERALVEIPSNEHKKLEIEWFADDIDDKSGHKKYAKIYEELIDEPNFATKLDEKGIDKTKLKKEFKDKQKSEEI